MRAYLGCGSFVLLVMPSFALEISTPQQVIDLSLRSSEVRKAASFYRQSEAEVTRAWDPYLPDFNWSAKHDLETGGASGSFGIRQNIYAKGVDIHGIRIARLNKESMAFNLHSTKQAAQLGALQAFFKLQTFSYVRKITRDQNEFLKGTLDRIRQLYKHQAAPRLQVWQLERQVNTLARTIKEQEIEYDSAISQFGNLFETNERISLSLKEPELLPIKIQFLSSPETLVSQALETSAEIKALNVEIEKTGPKRWLNYSDQMPELYVSANYGDSKLYGKALPKAQWSSTVNLNVPLPIFDSVLMLRPRNRIIAEEESRFRIDRNTAIRRITNRVKVLVDEIKSSLAIIEDTKQNLKLLDRELNELKKDYLIGSVQGVAFIVATENNMRERIAVKATIERINSDYVELLMLTRGNLSSVF